MFFWLALTERLQRVFMFSLKTRLESESVTSPLGSFPPPLSLSPRLQHVFDCLSPKTIISSHHHLFYFLYDSHKDKCYLSDNDICLCLQVVSQFHPNLNLCRISSRQKSFLSAFFTKKIIFYNAIDLSPCWFSPWIHKPWHESSWMIIIICPWITCSFSFLSSKMTRIGSTSFTRGPPLHLQQLLFYIS